MNVDWTVNYWLENGCPREKLVLGVATYGRVFKLKDSYKNEPGDLNDGHGTVGTVQNFFFLFLFFFLYYFSLNVSN